MLNSTQRIGKKKIVIIIPVIAIILIIAYYIVGNPFVRFNNYRLKQSIKAISKTEVTLNEVVPFEWDAVYTFEPYTSKAEIEKIIGFKSNEIEETISEGMVQLLFVKGGSIPASVCGYAENLGYELKFENKVEFKENAVFEVKINDGIVSLTKK